VQILIVLYSDVLRCTVQTVVLFDVQYSRSSDSSRVHVQEVHREAEDSWSSLSSLSSAFWRADWSRRTHFRGKNHFHYRGSG